MGRPSEVEEALPYKQVLTIDLEGRSVFATKSLYLISIDTASRMLRYYAGSQLLLNKIVLSRQRKATKVYTILQSNLLYSFFFIYFEKYCQACTRNRS